MSPLLARDPAASRRQDRIETTTIREFTGGWNVVDNQLNMQPKYQTVSDNVSLRDDGSLGVRYGTQEFIGEQYMLYSNPNVSQIAQGDGTIVSNATLNEAAAFNGARNTPTASCCRGTLDELIIGKDLGVARTGFCAVVFPSDDGRLITGTDEAYVQVTLEASTDGVTWEVIDQSSELNGTAVPVDGICLQYNTTPGKPVVATQSFLDAGYQHFRVRVTRVQEIPGAPNVNMIVGEVEFYEFITEVTLAAAVGFILHDVVQQDRLVLFWSNGTVYSAILDGSNTITLIWSAAIANALPGNPPGWSTGLEIVTSDKFAGDLIACNGVDKPLLINFDNANPVDYLQDLGSGSNANVPICRYVKSMNKYVVMAGDPLAPATVHISNVGTSGTWFGDLDPNDAVQIELDKVASVNDPVIRGVGRFRENAVVIFDEVAVIGQLGIYDDTGAHTPDFDDIIEQHGGIAHKSMIDVGDDLLMVDYVGVPSLRRGLISGRLEPERLSDLVDPEMQQTIGNLKINTTTNNIFSEYNMLDGRYMLFVPNHDPDAELVDHGVDTLFVEEIGTDKLIVLFPAFHGYEEGDRIRISGAAAFNDFTAADLNREHVVDRVPDPDNRNLVLIRVGTVSSADPAQQRGGGAVMQSQAVFTETICYDYKRVKEGSIKAWARYKGWLWTCSCRTPLGRVLFSDGYGVYIYGNHDFPVTSDFVLSGNERGIDWAWEMPWVDFDRRMLVKNTKYIGIDTLGTASFTASMFVNQIYYDEHWDRNPQLEMRFRGGSSRGFGGGTQPFGAGRITSTEKLYAWTARCKVAKLRFAGLTTEPLRFISVSLAYHRGTIRGG